MNNIYMFFKGTVPYSFLIFKKPPKCIRNPIHENKVVVILAIFGGEFVFGVIKHIFFLGSNVQLCCCIQNSVYFNAHYRSFCIEDTEELVLKVVGELVDCTVLSPYSVNNETLVALKYHIPI